MTSDQRTSLPKRRNCAARTAETTYVAIKTATAAGVSMHRCIADAAADRALAKQQAFVDASQQHRDAVADAFAKIDPTDGDPRSTRNLLDQADAAVMDVQRDEPHGNAAWPIPPRPSPCTLKCGGC
ncbi:hypothetical protein [Streptomyces sp. NPDC026673]|uniref:hypothetical protein n=1 Tax=Streptomyces sp. NPDC026673 TaxID=3155724 RepID=UPI0033F9E508